MARKFQPQMATGNDLLEGDVVYFTSAGDWSRAIGDAALAVNPEAADGPAEAGARRFRTRWSASIWSRPTIDDRGRAAPAHFREAFRTRGPSNYPQHGRQAERIRCTDTTISTATSCASGWRSSATRSSAASPASLTEDEFLPLRLMNGLYLQLHAYMLRVAIPYGTLNAREDAPARDDRRALGQGLRPLHHAAEHPVQLAEARATCPTSSRRWPTVEMHAIQTSGNCIRNVTADHFAGAAADEIEDPRPTAELIRQWSTDHPEFTWLPRKFKVAITGSPNDRAVTKSHDIGLRMVRDDSGRARLRGDDRRRPRPDADDRQDGAGVPAEGGPAALPRGDPAGLQPAAAGATTSTRRG